VPNPPLLLDACVTINLVAAGPIHQIARSVGHSCLITRQAANEVGHLRDTTDGETRLTAVHLTDHVQTGAFEIIDLTPDEIPLFVELASLVDDGEASTIAVAIKRGIPLATDDRKARRLCAGRGLDLPTGTVALIRRYCEAQALDYAHVSDLLQRISSHASFQAPRGDPDLKWWHDHQPDATNRDS
jgi:predicted nucleic acid-binding protein